jgi:hypothetical protein
MDHGKINATICIMEKALGAFFANPIRGAFLHVLLLLDLCMERPCIMEMLWSALAWVE